MSFVRLLFLMIIFSCQLAVAAEPIVVLQYGDHSDQIGSENSHPFVVDTNLNAKHKVNENETLSEIIKIHYGGSGINFKFVQMAILQLNKAAFVRGNPNYLYAGKTLHLPSINEIQSLIMGRIDKATPNNNFERRNEIFFFGS